MASLLNGYGGYQPPLMDLDPNAGGGGGSIAGGQNYYGTLAQRDATIPLFAGSIWTISDSNPPYQLSTWNGSAWD